ncbi:MAG: protein kinase [Archangium sp.]|nr:protein kinase [Archangium sp.]
MTCPDPETLAQYAQAALPDDQSESVRRHVDGCASCREVLITLVRSSQASPGSASDAPWDVPLPGTMLGRYRVTGTRGAGGMGVVLSAYDPQLDRQVALKLLRPDLEGASTEAGRHRLVREAQLMARVRHPNVVTVHDVVVEADRVSIAMELVEGVTLRDWLEQRPRTEDEILEVFVAAGRGLAAAHSAGVVHRDFKPDNVLVEPSGQVLVSDFGLAWSHALPSTESGSNAGLIGTPAYMAPEQLAGTTVDARADQFSFCVALFEALHGHRPFSGNTRAALLEAIGSGQLAAEPHKRSRRVSEVLRRGLSRDPASRFESMEALLSALRPPRRSLRTVAVVASVALVVLVGGGLVWVRSSSRCGAASARLAAAWTPERKASVTSRAQHVVTPFEAALRSVTEAWEATCGGSDERARTALTCLEARVGQLELTAEVLFAPTTEARAAMALVSKLDDPKACLDGELLTIVPLPATKEAPALVRQARLAAMTADALRLGGKLDDAAARAERSLTLARQSAWRPVEAEALLAQAQVLRARGKFKDAEAVLGDALLAAEAGRHFEAIARISVQHILVVGTQSVRPDEAEPWVKRAEAALEQLPRPRLRAEVDIATTMLRVAQGDFRRGEEVSTRALSWTRSNDRIGTADVLTLRAQLFQMHGQHRRALDEAREGMALRVELLGPKHPLTIHARVTVAELLARCGLAADAKTQLTDLLDETRKRTDLSPVTAATELVALGLALEERGEFAEALSSSRQGLEIVESVFGPKHRYAALARRAVGERLRAMGRTDEAVETLKEAIAIGEATVGPLHRETLESRGVLALTLALAGKPGAREEAVTVVQAAMADPSIGQAPLVPTLLALAATSDSTLEERTAALGLTRRVRGVPHPDVVRAMQLAKVDEAEVTAMKQSLQVLEP